METFGRFESIWAVLVGVSLVLNVSGTRRNPYERYDVLFKQGTEAYLGEDWQLCVNTMLSALDDYKFYKKALANCRLKCRDEADAPPSPLGPLDPHIDDDLDDFKFYAKSLKSTLCNIKCKKEKFGERLNILVPKYIEDAFETKQPYDYLQLCYYKTGNTQQAASCAYTFLAFNPEHEAMRGNLQFYASLPGVEMSHLKNLDTNPFQELFLLGNDAYNRKNYHEVTHYFEMALEEYYRAMDECRILCEGPFDQNGFPDFIMSVANHFTYTLKCKRRCENKMAFMYGEKYDDYLPSHYHYLQYAYFQVEEIEKACRAVGTYLLFHPDDKTMKYNKGFYIKKKGITEDNFEPTEEALHYWKRDKYEQELLRYIDDNYKFPNPSKQDQTVSVIFPSKTFSLTISQSLVNYFKTNYRNASPQNAEDQVAADQTEEVAEDERHLGETEEEQRRRLKKRPVDILQWSRDNGFTVVMGEAELNGTDRFVADGFMTRDQCDDLIQLASEAAVHGDGYNGKPSPHTEFERFEGLTVGRAAMLVKLGLVDVGKAQLLVSASEKGRDYVEKYFHMSQELFFSYTHLVCRTALPGAPEIRTDLSHPIHADNCLLMPAGDCVKERPAYTWRDYSAILYLNDDFEGGDFIFASNKDVVQSQVRPKCGRLVGFSAGKENLHGVQAVLEGRRCALAMWYTLDPNHNERERDLAQKLIDQVREEMASGKQTTFPSAARFGRMETNPQPLDAEKSAAENSGVLEEKGFAGTAGEDIATTSGPEKTRVESGLKNTLQTPSQSQTDKNGEWEKPLLRSKDNLSAHPEAKDEAASPITKKMKRSQDDIMDRFNAEEFKGYGNRVDL